MSWSYVVVKTGYGYVIKEVYFDDGGNVTGYTEDEIAPLGETAEELREDLEFMLKAFDGDVLDEVDGD